MLRPTLIFLSILALSLGGLAFAETPITEAVVKIEYAVQLPAGAGPLETYDRYYAPTTVSGRRMVVGVLFATHIGDSRERYAKKDAEFWKPGPKRNGRLYILANETDLPRNIYDGGCAAIRVYWDLETERIAGVFCNGLP